MEQDTNFGLIDAENTRDVAQNLSAFLAGNVKRPERCNFKPDRYERPFEIRIIDGAEYQRLRSACIKTVPAPNGKRGAYTQEFDTGLFQLKLCAACTAFPPLDNAQLQDSYGVYGEEALIGRMLLAGELDDYFSAIMKANGFKDESELVEEAKN
jgi:hypothetical protein